MERLMATPLGGTRRDRAIYRPPNHQVVGAPHLIPTDRGLDATLIIDLGELLTLEDMDSMEILAVDTHGSIPVAVTHIEEVETIPDSIWEAGHTYSIWISIPPRGLPLNEDVMLRVGFGEFGFGINRGLQWATYEPASTSESTEAPSTDESSDESSGESSGGSNP